MHTKKNIDPKTKQATREFIKKIAIQYKNFSGTALLFGSRARHTHQTYSDADVAILLKGVPGKFVVTKLIMDDIAYDVLLDTGIRIQPLPIWEEEWAHPEKYRNPSLLKNIHRDGIAL